MEDKVNVDNLINLITRLRDEADLAAGQSFKVEFLRYDHDHQFDAGTTENLIEDAAKEVGLEILQRGKDLALLKKRQVKGGRRKPILGR